MTLSPRSFAVLAFLGFFQIAFAYFLFYQLLQISFCNFFNSLM